MQRESTEPMLSAVFVDYDNIYLSLKRKSDEAAKRFSKDCGLWLREIESGRLITPTNSPLALGTRRLVSNRCYGNPVPRRNSADNSTDMSSFPFVRHHFLRAGFEIVDCPPLTAQLKNSSDIRMVMDVRDFLDHQTRFHEFVILSGDADFTPVLHRLRAHNRRTIIFANDYTATPYTAICDGEIREQDLVRLLLEGRLGGEDERPVAGSQADMDTVKADIIAEVVALVRQAGQPVPLEALAERAMRALGHDRTAGSNWAGVGSFRELLLQALPRDIAMTGEPPYLAYVASVPSAPAAPQIQASAPAARTMPAPEPAPAPAPQPATPLVAAPATRQIPPPAAPAPAPQAPVLQSEPVPQAAPPQQPVAAQPVARAPAPPLAPPVAKPAASAPLPPVQQTYAPAPAAARPRAPLLDTKPSAPLMSPPPAPAPAPATAPPAAPQAAAASGATRLQQSVARIQDACQAPPLSPPEYRALFEAMGQEITENGLQGAQTLANIQARTQDQGHQIGRDDIRFILDVVGEPDPWFEQGASANLFAGRFRNFVVARCRSQGLSLSSDELDLIEAWFAGGPAPQPAPQRGHARTPAPEPARSTDTRADSWWMTEPARPAAASAPPVHARQPGAAEPPALAGTAADGEEFPRIVRSRVRG